MKTLILFQGEVLSGDELTPKFAILEGDYRHLNDVYVNTYVEDVEGRKIQAAKEEELMNLFPEGFKWLHEPTKDWDYFIHCGFLP